MKSREGSRSQEGAGAAALLEVAEKGGWHLDWTLEKWEQDRVDHILNKMDRSGMLLADGMVAHNIGGKTIYRPRTDGLPSEFMREFGVDPDEITIIEGNLLLNEGIQRLLDLTIAAGGTAFNNANAFIGVGDTATAEAATQTELLATQNAANRFYKGMNATYPIRTAQSVDWRSDFTTTEANFVWNEWTIAAGATTASGSGFLVGTINLNRKVQSLGTKTTGTWTLTGTVTIS